MRKIVFSILLTVILFVAVGTVHAQSGIDAPPVGTPLYSEGQVLEGAAAGDSLLESDMKYVVPVESKYPGYGSLLMVSRDISNPPIMYFKVSELSQIVPVLENETTASNSVKPTLKENLSWFEKIPWLVLLLQIVVIILCYKFLVDFVSDYQGEETLYVDASGLLTKDLAVYKLVIALLCQRSTDADESAYFPKKGWKDVEKIWGVAVKGWLQTKNLKVNFDSFQDELARLLENPQKSGLRLPKKGATVVTFAAVIFELDQIQKDGRAQKWQANNSKDALGIICDTPGMTAPIAARYLFQRELAAAASKFADKGISISWTPGNQDLRGDQNVN